MKLSKSFYFASLMMLVFASAVFADVKIKSRQTVSGQTNENTTYIKGKRMRAEQNMGGGMQMINLTQCDLKRGVQMNAVSKTYIINMFNQVVEATEKPAAAQRKDNVVRAGGTVTTTATSKDTGETKKMFGYLARHIITTMETVSSADACSPTNTKMQIDGWYIDAAFVLDCQYDNYKGSYSGFQKQGCQDRYNMKTVGTAKKGYPVYEKMTMYDDGGKEMTSIISEVVELSQATLDQGLFEIPQDYREVNDMSQMYSASSMMNANSDSDNDSTSNSSNNSTKNSGTISAIKNQSQSNVSTEVGAKQPGTIRIGLANVKVGAVGDGITSADLASAIQNSLGEYLKGTKIELVPLSAKLSSAIESEAKQKECDYILYANASHKKGGGGFGGMFGKTIAQGIGAGLGATGNIVANVAAQTVVSASAMSANVKSKDEVTLEVKMNQPGNQTSVLTKQAKAKAKSDGEDIISPVVEQIAQAVFNAVGK